MKKIRSAADLADFAERNKLRLDWHEPDEQGVSARVVGVHLDNAMGVTPMSVSADEMLYGEMKVVLTDDHGTPLAIVNLCNLLAWASRPYRDEES